MPTTIQIDESTKKKLFQIKLELEQQKGDPVTYNEIVEFLINNQATNLFRKQGFKGFRKLRGVLSRDALDEFYNERGKELIREEKRAPLPESEYTDEIKKKIFNREKDNFSRK
ncbi:MAG: hypothetical protein EU547_03875 [Promethearchaeota archaeon]|nr:MAG: hypothetical protein EU547_03875 [Candidatus Lokiarchaeota archaeon]